MVQNNCRLNSLYRYSLFGSILLSLSCVASSQTRDTFAEQIIYILTLLLSRCCNIVAQRANVVPIILTPSGIADSSTVSRGMACRDTRNYFPTLDLDRGILTYCSDDLELLTRARVQVTATRVRRIDTISSSNN